MSRTLCALVAMILAQPDCFGHSGRTDSSGGHMNRRTGEYHYHGGGSRSSSSTSSSSSSASSSSSWLSSLARSSPPTPRENVARTRSRINARDARAAIQARTDWAESVDAIPGPVSRDADAATPILQNDNDALISLARVQTLLSSKDFVSAVRVAQQLVRKWPTSAAATTARSILQDLRDNEPLREWASKDNKYKVVAKFISEEGKRVVLSSAQGKVIRIALNDLSTNDQLYVIMRRSHL